LYRKVCEKGVDDWRKAKSGENEGRMGMKQKGVLEPWNFKRQKVRVGARGGKIFLRREDRQLKALSCLVWISVELIKVHFTHGDLRVLAG
jgi:hypothetical protein